MRQQQQLAEMQKQKEQLEAQLADERKRKEQEMADRLKQQEVCYGVCGQRSLRFCKAMLRCDGRMICPPSVEYCNVCIVYFQEELKQQKEQLQNQLQINYERELKEREQKLHEKLSSERKKCVIQAS